jgi:nucleotide-binding universal stress UspA family protein
VLQPRRKVCISMDDSVNSQHALEWLERALLKDGDEVHIAVVALPVPYPVSARRLNSAGRAGGLFACRSGHL